MARARSQIDIRHLIYIYISNDRNIANREIAKLLDISEKTISGWKVKDKWNESLNGMKV